MLRGSTTLKTAVRRPLRNRRRILPGVHVGRDGGCYGGGVRRERAVSLGKSANCSLATSNLGLLPYALIRCQQPEGEGGLECCSRARTPSSTEERCVVQSFIANESCGW